LAGEVKVYYGPDDRLGIYCENQLDAEGIVRSSSNPRCPYPNIKQQLKSIKSSVVIMKMKATNNY